MLFTSPSHHVEMNQPLGTDRTGRRVPCTTASARQGTDGKFESQSDAMKRKLAFMNGAEKEINPNLYN